MMKLVIQVYDPPPHPPPYVNGVVYLNDEAGHSSIRHPHVLSFQNFETLLYYHLKSGVLYFGSVTYSQQAIRKSVKTFRQARSRRQCFSEESNLHMSLHGELRAVLFSEETVLVVIEKTCQRCNTAMRFSVKASLSDKSVWRCKRKGCKTNVLVRDGSFFTKSKLPST